MRSSGSRRHLGRRRGAAARVRCRGRLKGNGDADVDVARGGGRGEGELVRRDAHDGPVVPMQRVDVVGAVAGGVDEREPFGRELGDEGAGHGAKGRVIYVRDVGADNLRALGHVRRRRNRPERT